MQLKTQVKKSVAAAVEHAPGLFALKLIDGESGAHDIALLRGWLEPGATHAPHTHEIEEAVLFTSGRGLVWIDGKRYEVGPGDAVHIPPHTPHSTVNQDPEEDLHFVAAFSGALIGSNPLMPISTAESQAEGGRTASHSSRRFYRLRGKLRWYARKLRQTGGSR